MAPTETLVGGLPASCEEATAALWRLCQVASQTKDSTVLWRAREIADVISQADPLNPRARFVYGYFRSREAIQTADPITLKRRLHEGRRLVADALMMGGRDPYFLLDAGLLVMSLSPKLDLVQRGLDALTLSRRSMGAAFEEMPASRRADWHAGMGKGFDALDLPELARDQFAEAVALGPGTPSGDLAKGWLKARNAGISGIEKR
ncbi:MAG: hypothetical protein M3R13_06035 [Armatimonadota bacterium]|nr:hypothetical protein [Armatimonadota bacterium]